MRGVGEKTASCNSLPIVQPRYSSVLAVNFNAVYTPSHILRAVNCPSGRITFVSDLSISLPSSLSSDRVLSLVFHPFPSHPLSRALHPSSSPVFSKAKENTATYEIEITEFTKSVEIPFIGPDFFLVPQLELFCCRE